MKKKIFKAAVAVVVIIIGIIYIASVINVNKLYPKSTVYTYSINEKFKYLDFSVVVKNAGFYKKDELKQKFKNVFIEAAELGDADYMLVAEIEAGYIGDSDSGNFYLQNICAQSLGFSNASDYAAIKSVNNSYKCSKGESITVYTMIPIRQSMFPERESNNFCSRQYQLVFSTYPDIIQVKVN